MNTSIPDDYDMPLELYSTLKTDYEEIKQNLYESSRQLKLKDALIREYQGEIEILQNGETSRHLKYEAKIASLEETLASLRSSHQINITYLETDLLKKDKDIEDMKIEIDTLKRKNLLEEKCNISLKSNEVIDMSNENELLKEKYEELQEAFDHFRVQHVNMEHTLQEYQEQTIELSESLKSNRETLSEKSVLIDKLNDELFTAKRDLEIYKHKPLQDGSKGNSLFAEVDDRRVHLQRTVNDMKSSYVHLKQEHSKHEKIISHLRKENTDLRALWKKDLEQIQEDHNAVVDTLHSRLTVLEEINDRQKHQLEKELKPSSDDLCAEYQFYQDIIESKSAEIKKLEKGLSDRSVTEHMLSMSLAQANKELRLLRLSMLELQQQIEENKEKELLIKETDIYHRYTIHNDEILDKDNETEENIDSSIRSNMKSCLKPIENIIQDLSPDSRTEQRKLKHANFVYFNKEDNNLAKELSDNIVSNDNESRHTIATENQENGDFDNFAPIYSKKRGVKFSEATVSPASTQRRRGTKIFVMKKKTDDGTGNVEEQL